ncbi:MAG TPA: methyl-accepting chemotaxis protein, partial [Kineosporiaceae bacterium]|nr:methyl-accepting chemotaxis protein [Kineosporiaceae bacterium]
MAGLRWTVGRKLAALSAIGVLVAGVVGVVAYVELGTIQELSRTSGDLATADQVMATLDKSQSEFQLAEAKSLLATDQASADRAVDELGKAIEENTKAFGSLQGLTLPPEVRQALGELQNAYQADTEEVKARMPALAQIPPGTAQALAALGVEERRSTAMEERIAKLRQDVNDRVDAADKNLTDTAARVRATVAIVLGVGLVALIVLAWWISRLITRPLAHARDVLAKVADGDLSVRVEVHGQDEVALIGRATNDTVEKLSEVVTTVVDSAQQLSNAAGQVSSSAQSLSQTTAEQAASVEETTSSIEQMAASVNQNGDNAKVTDGIAGKAAQQAGEGGQAVQQTVQAMKDIAAKIAIIDDIAFQTNML